MRSGPSELRGPGGELLLSFERDICGRHLEPLRADWPKGAAMALLLFLDSFLSDDRVQRMAGFDPEAGAEADVGRIPALVSECSPLCCYLGDELAAELTAEALAGHGPHLEEIRRRQEVRRREDEDRPPQGLS